MKRGISLLLCMAVLALVGCGTSAPSEESKNNAAQKETPAVQMESKETTGSKTEEAGTAASVPEPEQKTDMEGKTLVA